MEKKNYFNFMAFRKGLYDGKLSERARLVYIHFLQKSSSKGCSDNALYNDIELTKELIAIDLGILTKTGEPSTKLIQRALEELEENGYIKRFQKYKTKGCPLTIRLNFRYDFLNKKENEIEEIHLCGFDTEACVLKTALDFFENNYNVKVLEDYTMSNSGLEYHNWALNILRKLIGKE